jgi:hypothetical protein
MIKWLSCSPSGQVGEHLLALVNVLIDSRDDSSNVCVTSTREIYRPHQALSVGGSAVSSQQQLEERPLLPASL